MVTAGPTLIVTVAGAEFTVPSLTVNVNESVPVKPGAGEYVRLGPTPDSVP